VKNEALKKLKRGKVMKGKSFERGISGYIRGV